MPSRRLRPVAHRVVALCCGLSVVSLLTACGASSQGANITPTGTGTPSATTTATAAPVDRSPFVALRVVRTSAFPQNKIAAFDATSADRGRIAQLYDALLALQPYPPRGYFSCPIDVGVTYHLSLVRYDGARIAALAAPDGCGWAEVGDGPTLTLRDVQGFWELFAATLGVPLSAVFAFEPGAASGPYAPTDVPAGTAGPASAAPFVRLHAVREGLPAALDETVTDGTKIAALYDAIAALTPFPPGPVWCDNDTGAVYGLTFTRADGTQIAGLAKPDGCAWAGFAYATTATITVGAIRDVSPDGFWGTFGATFGLPASAVEV
jgi:hypothetical protein